MNENGTINVDMFPPVPLGRRLYFEYITPDEAANLRAKGYDPVVLFSLPRTTEAEHKAYLLAISQGLSDGTIQLKKGRLDALELEMRAHGMLNKEISSSGDELKRTSLIEDLLTKFGKKGDRHVLFQTTITDPRVVESLLLKEAGLIKVNPKEAGKVKRKWKRPLRGRDEE
jgi:hypothetical protein